MITLTKGTSTKFVDEESSLIPLLLEQGWIKEVKDATPTKKKEVKDAIPSTTVS